MVSLGECLAEGGKAASQNGMWASLLDDVAFWVKEDMPSVVDQARAMWAGGHVDLAVIGVEPSLEIDNDGIRLVDLDGLS